MANKSANWPDITIGTWAETAKAVHLYSQVLGKVRLVTTPWTNHSWHVPLYVNARGLTTSLMFHRGVAFEMRLDLVTHEAVIESTSGQVRRVELAPSSVAGFYRSVMDELHAIGVDVRIHTTPSEIADAVPFERDDRPRPYDRDAVTRFWHALVCMQQVFQDFRSDFRGKCSPVHFFWGSFDLAVTRFSGRTAPPHPGGVPNFPDWAAREAYSHEVSSAGFWPGGDGTDAIFYSYAYPKPDGFENAAVEPNASTWSDALGEFVLPYDAVRASDKPDAALKGFLESTYRAAADAAGWDREALECNLPADAR
ncbi:MAG: DUF5996 family protein [Phycisphaerales bacterium JB060]